MAQCDALDGLKDGIISQPEKCHYDPAALLCKGADGPACLTPGQLETVKIVFGDVKTEDWAKSSGPATLPARNSKLASSLRTYSTAPGGVWDVIRILGHQDKNYDWHNFDPGCGSGAGGQGGDRRAHLRPLGVQGTRWEAAALSRSGRFVVFLLDTPCSTTTRCWQKMGEEAGRLAAVSIWSREWGIVAGGRVRISSTRWEWIERWRESGQAPEARSSSSGTFRALRSI